MLKLTLQADTLGGLVHEMRQILAQIDAGTDGLAIMGMAENTTADSPDPFVPDFKDDFSPYMDGKLDDPLPEAMAEPKQTHNKKLTPKKKAEPAKKSSRRKNNGKANPAKAATSVGTDVGLEISDRDVGKAASAAAQTLTPKVVQEIKGEYGVSNVQELDQDQRREFIDQLNGLLEEANG